MELVRRTMYVVGSWQLTLTSAVRKKKEKKKSNNAPSVSGLRPQRVQVAEVILRVDNPATRAYIDFASLD